MLARTIVTLLLAGLLTAGMAQPKITLENIWQDYTFAPNSVPGFNFEKDGEHYTRLENNSVAQYDLTTGVLTQVLFDASSVGQADGFNGRMQGYAFSDDEHKLLIRSETEYIYRHSTRARYHVWDGAKLTAVFPEGKVRYATFNPQADKVAFVYENDLYYKDLRSGKVVRVTSDGKQNHIINGATDWVYEEEFSFASGFQWSPDGAKLAYYRFDESRVKEFTMTNYRGELYPEYETFKYPKVGEDNAIVTIHIYHLTKGRTVNVDMGPMVNDQYIPRIKWTNEPGKLCLFRMNRHQNDLELLLADAVTGKTNLLLHEQNEYYIDIHDNLTFLADGKHFVWTSEQSGWNHIYLYDMQGKLVKPLTSGEWEVTEFYGVDEANGRIFFQAAKESPLRRDVYAIDLDGTNELVLSDHAGWNSAQFSSTFDYYVQTHSTINSPAVYAVYDRNGGLVRTIEDNSMLVQLQSDFEVSPAEFFTFTTSENVELNGYTIKPPDFDSTRKYPVFMFLYGGPGSQQVVDQWRGQNYWWFQMLAQEGFIVACVDNRGTGGRGEAFKKMTYLQLGHYETIDQIEAAKYLGSLPYTDADRIGIFGWSYGGYMSSLCLLKGNEVFKAAIAVAPVTNWKWYDTIYTERFMRTDAENPDGYRDNSPVNFADRLRGNYLLVHGMGDDNVHFQHTAEMANALIAAGKQYDTYFYPNRNHGIGGGNTRLHLYTKMTNFLYDKLMGDRSPVGAPRP